MRKTIFNLDLRTIFLTNSGLLFFIEVFLFVLWIEHRKKRKGIDLILAAILSLTLGTLGMGIQSLLHPVFTVVLSNTLIVLAYIIPAAALRLFYRQKVSMAVRITVMAFIVITFAEQYWFGIVRPVLIIRIITVSGLIAAGAILTALFLIRNSHYSAPSEKALILSFLICAFTLIFRIPVSASLQVTGSFMKYSGAISFSMLLTGLTSIGWATGCMLLVAAQAARDRDLLLRELSHRTKNNFSVIISMIELQKIYFHDKAAASVLNDIRDRINSMASAQSQLYCSDCVLKVNLHVYLNNLVETLCTSHLAESDNIDIYLNTFSAALPNDLVVSIGLLVTELTTNSLKHAFPDRWGRIDIEISSNGEFLILKVSDDGIGQNTVKVNERSKSMGMGIIKELVGQLGGTWTVDSYGKSSSCEGTTTTIVLPYDFSQHS